MSPGSTPPSSSGTTATPSKRFRVAFSFAGEKRDFVKQMAELLATIFGEDAILYDHYHEAEFANPELGFELPDLYHDQSDLIVVIICPHYDAKEWPGLEWRAIFDLVKRRQYKGVMLCNFGRATARGLYSTSGYVGLDDKTPHQAACLIAQRLALNEGLDKEHYVKELKPVKPAATLPDPAKADRPPSPAPPAFHAVPEYLGSHQFVGRKAELESIDDWADAADPHPVLLFEAIGGMGKSMLTWHWARTPTSNARARLDPARGGWAGQLWYSFYERGAVMEDFIRHALAYITLVDPGSLTGRPRADLAEELLRHLKEKPYLLILDGLERVLVAYHRLDAAQMADEQADNPHDTIAKRDPCSTIRPEDEGLLRKLASAAPSKILISTRLTPNVLLNASRQAIPGVRREILKGLRPPDAEAMLRSQDVRGDSARMQAYLKTNCDCHPLVVGVLAGLIHDYLPDRGNFDAWAEDAGETGGGRLNLAELDLKQKKTHILNAAIAALPPKGRELLHTLALVAQAVDYDVLQALNPHLPLEPEKVEEPEEPEDHYLWEFWDDDEKAKHKAEHTGLLARYEEYQQAIKARLASAEYKAAPRRLAETIKDLEHRGLIQYDANSKRYDLHPVVRGLAAGGLKPDETDRYGQRVVDVFSSRPHSPYEQAKSLADVENGVQIVRTLLQMGKMEEAADAYRGDLAEALGYNLEADEVSLSLMRPFFPDGWGTLPVGLDDGAASYLANNAGNALIDTGAPDEARAAYAASLQVDLKAEDWPNLRISLSNISDTFGKQNRLAMVDRVRALALNLALASEEEASIFSARLDRSIGLSNLGRWDEAQQLWNELDPKGRDWPRNIYRPGDAERSYAWFSFYKGGLREENLAKALALAEGGHNRSGIRDLHALRAFWRAERGEWPLAAESLMVAVRMAREVGRTDAWSETWLALAQFHTGTLHDPRAETERLVASGDYANRPMAELWLALGDKAQAIKHAHAAYRGGWADGEPYVHRYELTKAAELLTRLGEPIPTLPPYDPAKDPPLEWEADVRAAIEKLKKEKAEREAKEAQAKRQEPGGGPNPVNGKAP